MSIEQVFELFKTGFEKAYPQYAGVLKNASGIPGDIGKPSDVDIAFYVDNHSQLDHLFPGFTKDEDTLATVYSTNYLGREVNIYATSDEKLANRGVIHRRNEAELASRFPQLLAKVVELKLRGVKTEPAWAQVLELSGDPYEAMLELKISGTDC